MRIPESWTRRVLKVALVCRPAESMKEYSGMLRPPDRVTVPGITSNCPMPMVASSLAICLVSFQTQVLRVPTSVGQR